MRAVSWPHNQTIDAVQATAELKKLSLRLSRSLDQSVQDAQPQVVEVWFGSNPVQSATGGPSDRPGPMLMLQGSAKLSAQTINWATVHKDDTLKSVFASGGRVSIRVHCDVLIDQKQKQFSASLAPMLNVQGMPLPGGVFDSWFFLK